MPFTFITTVLARIIVIAAVSCLLWSSVPTLWGWTATTVMSDSMAPSLRTGDVIVAMPVADPAASVGRVILFEDPDPDRLRLHRLVGLTLDGLLTTRGDANTVADSSPVAPAAVRGIAVMRAPALGLPFVWAREGRWELLLLTTAIAVVLFVIAFGQDRPRPAASKEVARVIPSALSLVAAVTVLTIVGSGTTAHAAFASQTPNPGNTFAAVSTFGCLAATPLDSPYLLYPLNEATASATDASGNGRSGALLAGATREAGDCTDSAALALAGTITSGITVPGAPIAPPDTFSLEIWFRTTSTTGGELIGFGEAITGESGVADRRIWMTDDGVLRFGVRPNSVRTISTLGTYNDGAWHHAVATLSTSGMRLYVDGVLCASNSTYTSGYHYNPFGSDGHWRVGGDTMTGMSGATDPTLASSIDNPAVYTTALTATQVAVHFAVGR